MSFDFHDMVALLDRLSRPNPPRPHVFLVGSALTMPLAGHRGVPGTSGVVELIRQHYHSEFPDAVAAFDQYIATSGINQYQAAFRHLNGRGGLEDANRIVRQAVLKAYAGSPIPDAKDRKACERAESLAEDWPLSPWVEALGELLNRADSRRLDPLILTTNFDPFLSVSVRRSGGTTYRSVLDRDGNLGQVSGDGCHVVHLHGHWCIGDTLHTPTQLGTERRGLKESLRRLLANKTLVVLGYGGWDDIFTSALVDALKSSQDRIELLWLFREARADAETKYAPLLGRLRAGYERAEVALYDEIDLCRLLPALRDRMLIRSFVPQARVPQAATLGANGSETTRDEGLAEDVTIPASHGPNPFGDTGRITDPTRFFDREEISRQIFEELAKGTNISLVGEAQVGKSSLMSWICAQGRERLGSRFDAFVYLSLEWVQNEAEFYEALCDALSLPPGNRGYKLTRELRGKRFVLCLDELEKMAWKGFTQDVRSQLRGLADGGASPLTLVVASRSPLSALFPDSSNMTSPLAGICHPLDVLPFSPEKVRNFLAHRLLGTGVAFSETMIEDLVAETGGHPGKLQRAAAERYRAITQSSPTR